MGDAAHGGGAQIDVGLGLDLAGTADDRGQILPYDLGGQNLGVAGLLPINEEGDEPGSHDNGKNNQENLLHVRVVLRGS